LFEIEVPEVYNGIVEIKAIAREAGFRSKVAVNATQQGIDPVGSCIGIRGNRIQSIVNELQGEKIDVVSWDKDPRSFISKALSPSEPVHVELVAEEQTAIVVVPDRQLSLAIGKEGQNTRLAARLTGWRLDIKGLTEWEELREERLRKAQQESALEHRSETVVAQEAAEEVLTEAVAEAAEEIAEAVLAEATAIAEAVAEAAPQAEAEAVETAADVLKEAVPEQDEEEVLDALIREEEEAVQLTEAEAVEEPETGFSVEVLESFTLEGLDLVDEEDEAEEDEDRELDLELLPNFPVLTPDAGKIRFAEDIVDESRGSGRRERKGRRSGAGSRGPRRGGR
jgi:transcription antitermination factor NusA-like protein